MSNPSDQSRGKGNILQDDEAIDLRELFLRLANGLSQTVGLGLLGLVIAAAIFLSASRLSSVSTSTRVIFSFPGFSRGQYPDGSKFRADDVGAPDVIGNALQNSGLNTSSDYQSQIRDALTIEGIIPADVVKVHDRLRATGQIPPPYFPDEYLVDLSLPRNFPLDNRQRSILLNAIVTAYRDKFQATYVKVPIAFGMALDSLATADVSEYEQILLPDIQNLLDYLTQELDEAKDFRSQATNLSFSDLLARAQTFSQIRVNEILGLIRLNGLSYDRNLALTKINYHLQTVEEEEQSAIGDEKVIQGLLNEARDRSQSYVVGIKSEATRPEGPLLDQGLVDSLVANDSYNFLIRKELAAGLKVEHFHGEKTLLLERRQYLMAVTPEASKNNAAILVQVQKSLVDLKDAYQKLVTDIRNTQTDFANQQFANAISLSDNIHTQGLGRPLAIASGVGLFLGLALGAGFSLLGIHLGKRGHSTRTSP